MLKTLLYFHSLSCTQQFSLLASSPPLPHFDFVHIPTLPTFPQDCNLDGTNYRIWKVMMQFVVESYDLDELISGNVPCLDPDDVELSSIGQ